MVSDSWDPPSSKSKSPEESQESEFYTLQEIPLTGFGGNTALEWCVLIFNVCRYPLGILLNT